MDNNQDQEQEQVYIQTDSDQQNETPQTNQEQPTEEQQPTYADNPKSLLLMGGLLLAILAIGAIYFFIMGNMSTKFVAAEPTTAPQNTAESSGPTVASTIAPTIANQAGPTAIPENPGNINRKHHLVQIHEALLKYKKTNGSLPAQITTTPQMIAHEGANLCPILVPAYMHSLPKDPITEEDAAKPIGSIKDCNSMYVTGYVISINDMGIVTITAPYAEDNANISVKF